MKILRRALAVIALLALFALPAAATAEDTLRDAVPDSAREMLEGVDLTGDLARGVARIAENAWSGGAAEGLFSTLRPVLATALIIGVLSVWDDALRSPLLHRTVRAAGCAITCILLAGGSGSLLGQARAAIEDMTAFSGIFTAVYTAACAAAGSPGAAMARQSVAVLISGAFCRLSGAVLLPLAAACALLKSVSAALETPGLSHAAGMLKDLMSGALKISLALYSAYITLSGVIGSAGDTLLKRGVKSGVSAAIPVVGSALSEACEAIFAGAAAVRNTVGVMGTLILLGTALLPLLRMLLWYAALKVTAAGASLFASEGVGQTADAAAESMGLMLAITAADCAVQLIAVFAGFLTFA